MGAKATSEAQRHEARRTWLTTAQVADQLGGCSPSHVRRLVKLGHLRAYNAGLPNGERHDWRFRQEWIDAYLASQTRVPKVTNGAA